jgi:hypothetical protein
MKLVLQHILRHKRDYAQLPFFEHLRDARLSARERLAFYPAMANFIMDFGDFNRHVLRDDASTDPHQQMINAHSREDDHHWPWYLEDYIKLGFNDHSASPSQMMNWLWSDDVACNRMLSHRLAHLVWGATPAVRLAVVEAIEETGQVLFSCTASLASAVQSEIGVELRYLGEFHFARESGHAMNNDHAELAAITLDAAARQDAMARVDAVFALFGEWTAELLRYAQTASSRSFADAPRALESTASR